MSLLNLFWAAGGFLEYIFVLIAYPLLGAGIKYIDDAFDEKVYSLKRALFVAPMLGILWAFTMSLSISSTTILAAVVLGVLVKGKIDNIAHQIGAISILAVLFFSGIFEFLWIPLALLVFAGMIDEVGNDLVDKGLIKNRFFNLFFEYRFLMKLAVLSLVILGYFHWIYFIAFVFFDLGYELVNYNTVNLIHHRKFYYQNSNTGSVGRLLNERR